MSSWDRRELWILNVKDPSKTLFAQSLPSVGRSVLRLKESQEILLEIRRYLIVIQKSLELWPNDISVFEEVKRTVINVMKEIFNKVVHCRPYLLSIVVLSNFKGLISIGVGKVSMIPVLLTFPSARTTFIVRPCTFYHNWFPMHQIFPIELFEAKISHISSFNLIWTIDEVFYDISLAVTMSFPLFKLRLD